MISMLQLTFQADILRILQLNDFVKSSINVIKTEHIKVFIVLMRLQQHKFI